MLTVKENDFYMDGSKIRILSGAVHYFRIPKERWADTIWKAKLMGLNTIETYIAWNVHEKERGEYNFSGMYDICAFLDEVKKAGMYAIVRPGPYICAEWDFGGFPYWLLQNDNIRLRCMDESYISEVSRWFDKLIPMLAEYKQDKGGSIIAVQIENEYGSYGNDKRYLSWLKEKMVSLGLDGVFFFTSDGYSDFCLQGGTLPEVFKVVNFGSNAAEAQKGLRAFQKEGPFMCGEFWNGWFDYWGGRHQGHDRSDKECADELDEILKRGGSANLYMFHGGTNFGFMAGANASAVKGFEPDVTSYDYGAPLDESGDITGKYTAMRQVLKKYTEVPQEELPGPGKKISYGTFPCTGSARLFDSLEDISHKVDSPAAYPMEYYGQGYGYILYRTHVGGPRAKQPVVLQEVRDRALIFADGRLLGITDRNQNQRLSLDVPGNGVCLDVLVENLARVNYGPDMKDKKGVTEGIRLGNQFLFQYEVYCLPMEDLSGLRFGKPVMETECGHPAFYRFEPIIEECADTYLNMERWEKGFVTVNGFNLGRYWNIGPQKKLFLPRELLRKGRNEIIVFEEGVPGGHLEL